jgi:hypothetical protein
MQAIHQIASHRHHASSCCTSRPIAAGQKPNQSENKRINRYNLIVTKHVHDSESLPNTMQSR